MIFEIFNLTKLITKESLPSVRFYRHCFFFLSVFQFYIILHILILTNNQLKNAKSEAINGAQ